MKTKNHSLTILIIFLLFQSAAFAQINFEKTFSFSFDNVANDVKQTSDSGFIITGSANLNGNADADVFLIKTNAAGDTLWTRTFSDTANLSGNSVCQTNDGGYIVSGTKTFRNTGFSDVLLVKTDASGHLQWSKEIDLKDYDYGYGVVQTADNGYVFSGYESDLFQNSYAHLIKTNSSGTVLWSKTYEINTVSNYSYSLIKTTDGGFMMAGGGSSVTFDFNLIKTDANGTIQWQKTYGDADDDENYCVAQTNDGGFILAGTNYNGTTLDYDISVIRVDSLGVIEWTRNYGDNGGGYAQGASSIVATSDNGFIVAGYTSSLGSNSTSWIFKINFLGGILWSRVTPTTGYDGFNAVCETYDGGCLAVGYKNRDFGASGEISFVRTDANGITPCNQNYSPLMSITPMSVLPYSLDAVTVSTSSNLILAAATGATVTSVCSGDPTRNVWPGDCNYDLVVNNMDFLYLGCAYNDTGATRPAATTNWVSQPAVAWINSYTSNGVNHKHADCNGDGKADTLDATAIRLNYGNTHPLRTRPQTQVTATPYFSLIPNRSIMAPGDTVIFSIRLGNASLRVDSLYGIAYTLSFDATLTDTNQVFITYSPSVLGTLHTNLMSFEKTFYSTGNVDEAVCRTNHQNVSNAFGELGKLSIVAASNITTLTTLYVVPLNIRGITNGEALRFFSDSASSVIIDPGVGINELTDELSILTYPNPVKDKLHVNSKASLIKHVDVADISGRIVYSDSPVAFDFEIPMEKMEDGVYFLALKTGSKVVYRKVLVVR